jgi:hypothetical protein
MIRSLVRAERSSSITTLSPVVSLALAFCVIHASHACADPDTLLDVTAVYEVIPHALSVTGGLAKVSVDTCLGSDGEWPYVWTGNPGQRDGSWRC